MVIAAALAWWSVETFKVNRDAILPLSLNGKSYRFEIYRPDILNSMSGTIVILFKNDKLIWSKSFGGAAWPRKMDWPYSDDAFTIKESSWAGSSDSSWIFRVQGKSVVGPIFELRGDIPGGPVFKDLDGDGRPEMLFDNLDHYANTEEHPLPDKYLVYKVDKRLRIKHWKDIPNPKHNHLPYWNPHFEDAVGRKFPGNGHYSLREIGLTHYAYLWDWDRFQAEVESNYKPPKEEPPVHKPASKDTTQRKIGFSFT